MIKSSGKKVVVVIVFTGYEDGSVDFTQDAPYKDKFEQVKACFKSMIGQLRNTLRDEAKCPFSPRNPQEYRYEENTTPSRGNDVEA